MTAELGEKRLADLTPRDVYARRFNIPEGHRFGATQALMHGAIVKAVKTRKPERKGLPVIQAAAKAGCR